MRILNAICLSLCILYQGQSLAGCAANPFGAIEHNGSTIGLTTAQAFGHDTIHLPVGGTLSLHISYNCFPADADWSLNGVPFHTSFGNSSTISTNQTGTYSVHLVNWYWPVYINWIVVLDSIPVSVPFDFAANPLDLVYSSENRELSIPATTVIDTGGTVELIDMQGKVVLRKLISSWSSWEPLLLNMGPLPNGIFIVRLRSGSETWSRRMAFVN